MKRSEASAWNFLLSLEGTGEAGAAINGGAARSASSTKAPSSASGSVSNVNLQSNAVSGAQPNAGNGPKGVAPVNPRVSATQRGADGARIPAPTQHELLHLHDGVKLVIGMVGLPARGKSLVARKITNYFSWLGYDARHFEVASLRRERLGVQSEMFFDPNNERSAEARAVVRSEALDEVVNWLRVGAGQVAVYDTTNGTPEQREYVAEHLRNAFAPRTGTPTPPPQAASPESPTRSLSPSGTADLDMSAVTQTWCRLIWIECSLDSPAQHQNFVEATLRSPDFAGLTRDEALVELEKKMVHYQKTHVSLESGGVADDISYVTISDLGRRVVANVNGYLESKLVSFLMNIHVEPRTIVLTRHAQAMYNVSDRVGGDSDLTPEGERFAKNLAVMCVKVQRGEPVVTTTIEAQHESPTKRGVKRALPPLHDSAYVHVPDESGMELPAPDPNRRPMAVWTSTARRAVRTAESVPASVRVQWNALTEIDAGACESMTYDEIRTRMSLEFAERQKDKFHWRYPRGESYADVVRRLEPVIFEIERLKQPVVVVAHRAVLRCLLGYFEGHNKSVIPFLPIPLHSVIQLTCGISGAWASTRYMLSPDVGDKGAHQPDLKRYKQILDGANPEAGSGDDDQDDDDDVLELEPPPMAS